jgi:hypothetical protein
VKARVIRKIGQFNRRVITYDRKCQPLELKLDIETLTPFFPMQEQAEAFGLIHSHSELSNTT